MGTYICVQKEEMGEVLHEVDFNQLKIENQQYLEKIDERNQDLLRLKLMAGNTLQVLNSYKVTGLQIEYSWAYMVLRGVDRTWQSKVKL